MEPPIELEIEGLASGGRGVARRDNLVWFVAGGLPGDRVLAETRLRRPRYVEARLLRLLRASPDRREPPCGIQSRCGGCPWMPLTEDLQRDWKRRVVRDALERIGGLAGLHVEPVVCGGSSLGYRNKVELSLGTDESGRAVLGFHGSGDAAAIVDVERCPLQHESSNRALAAARSILLDPDGPFGAAFTAREPHRLVIRRSWHSGAVLVAIREAGAPFPELARFARRLAESCPDVQGIVRLVAKPGRRGGARAVRVTGPGWIDERVGELVFRLPAASFLQVNTEMATALARLVVECADCGEGDEALDLYGGVGANGLQMALAGARVAICDADRDGIACGRRAARALGLTRVSFTTSDVLEFLRSQARPAGGGESIVANPPRDGLGRDVPAAILRRRPRRLVLVSCDPATLARDLRILVKGGLSISRVVPLDMFPQTAHVETVVTLVPQEPNP